MKLEAKTITFEGVKTQSINLGLYHRLDKIESKSGDKIKYVVLEVESGNWCEVASFLAWWEATEYLTNRAST